MTKAFTLAEVLITLGIIGIVSALAMPTLIANYQKHQTVTQLKKGYSVLNQAVKLASLDYEEFETKGVTQAGAAEYLEQYFLPYLKTVQVCTPITECGIDYLDYKFLNGDATSTNSGINASSTGVLLSDGNVFMISPGNETYYLLYLDINGKKGPNVLGKDLFRFNTGKIIPGEGIKFAGQGQDREGLIGIPQASGNGCNSSATGKYCAALIMHDGWEIRDDYPW